MKKVTLFLHKNTHYTIPCEKMLSPRKIPCPKNFLVTRLFLVFVKYVLIPGYFFCLLN